MPRGKLRRMTLEEALEMLAGASVGSLYIDIEELPKGKYVLPPELISALFTSEMDGTLKKRSGIEVEITEGVAGAATASVVADANWELIGILVSLQASATAANRTLQILISKYIDATAANADLFGSDGPVISANQWGSVWLTVSRDGYYLLNDNGTRAWSSNTRNIMPNTLRSGDMVTASFTNNQTGDKAWSAVWYRQV